MKHTIKVDGEHVGNIQRDAETGNQGFITRDAFGEIVQDDVRDYGDALWSLLDDETWQGDIHIEEK